MPAINLSRLKTQVARLGDHFHDITGFLIELHELLDFYTNRTKRSSQVARRIGLPTYNTPVPVIRQIERELAPLADRYPVQGVLLAKELWNNGSLEYRLLAARLTGMLPPVDAMPLLTQLPDWLSQISDRVLHRALLTDCLSRLRYENPSAFYLLLEDWLKSPRSSLQIWGLQALLPLLIDPDFQNLPIVFRIIRPTVIGVSTNTQIDVQAVICAIEHISLTETIFYLHDILISKPPNTFIPILRRMLTFFSPELQTAVRSTLRELGY